MKYVLVLGCLNFVNLTLWLTHFVRFKNVYNFLESL